MLVFPLALQDLLEQCKNYTRDSLTEWAFGKDTVLAMLWAGWLVHGE